MVKTFNEFCKDFIKKFNLSIEDLANMIGKTSEETSAMLEGTLCMSTHEKSRIRKLLEEFTPAQVPKKLDCEAVQGVSKEQVLLEYLKAYANNSVIFGEKNLRNFQEQFREGVKKLKPLQKSDKDKTDKILNQAMDDAADNAAEIITKLFNQFGDRGFEGADLYFAVELALKYLI